MVPQLLPFLSQLAAVCLIRVAFGYAPNLGFDAWLLLLPSEVSLCVFTVCTLALLFLLSLYKKTDSENCLCFSGLYLLLSLSEAG